MAASGAGPISPAVDERGQLRPWSNYKAWNQQGSEWSVETPSGYLNLLEPRDRYPLDPGNVPGCLEVFKLLLPNSWAEAG